MRSPRAITIAKAALELRNFRSHLRLNARPERALHVHRIGVASLGVGGDGHLEQLFAGTAIAAHHGERRGPRLHLQRLDLYLLSEVAMKLDRFSDDYGGAWPELWTRILAMSQQAYGRSETLPGTSQNVIPLFAFNRDAVRAEGMDGLNIDIVRISASEDEADSSLHHDVSMSRQILARLVDRIKGGAGDGQPHLFGRPAREISFHD